MMKFSIMGDSISTLDGYHPPECAVFYTGEVKFLSGVFEPEDTWWGQVIAACGEELLVNNAWSSSTVSRHPACEVPSYACSDERTAQLGKADEKPDVVLVWSGTNDWGCNMRIWPKNEAEAHDPAVFAVAYATMLQKIKQNYPAATVCCMTLTLGDRRDTGEATSPFNRAGVPLRAYADAVRQCAREQACALIDFGDGSLHFETIDGYHPTADGMKTIADAVIPRIKQILHL